MQQNVECLWKTPPESTQCEGWQKDATLRLLHDVTKVTHALFTCVASTGATSADDAERTATATPFCFGLASSFGLAASFGFVAFFGGSGCLSEIQDKDCDEQLQHQSQAQVEWSNQKRV